MRALGAEIDDLYLILRAQTAPLTEGFLTAGSAGEELAAKLAASMTEITASVDRMAENARIAGGSIDEMTLKAAADYDRLALATMEASAKMEAATAKAAAANERVGESLAATPAKTGPSAMALGMVALSAGAIGYESIKMAGNFESATERLVTSAGEIQSNVGAVRSGILDMAGQVGDSAQQLADAMYIIESGGQHGADGLKVLRAAAEGAKTENADLKTVADAVTSVLQDYHLKADAAATVTSKLVAGVGAGKTNFQDLAGSLHSVLPLASSLHISLDDVVGSLASMTVHGMSADQAAQNLNDTIRHLAAPTQVQVKELGQLGVSASDLSGMLGTKGVSGTLQYLSEVVMQHMGPSGRVLLDSFNKSKDAAADANKMIAAMPKGLQDLAHAYQNGSISVTDWREKLKALPPEQANLLSQFATLQNRASGFNDILKSGSPAAQTYQDAMRRVTGDATGLNTALMLTGENTDYVNNAVKTVAGATAEAGGHVKGWSEIQGTFNQKMSEAKAGLGALSVEVGEKLLPPVSTFIGWLAKGAEWLAKHHTLATALAVALGVLAVGFTIAAVAIWIMNSALFANPITWIILAIVALIAGIILLATHWKTVWGGIWDFMKMIGRWFAGPFADFFVKLWTDYIWGDFLQPVGHWFEAVFNDVKGFLFGIGHWFSHDFVDFFRNTYRSLQNDALAVHDWLIGKWDALVGFITGIPGRIRAAASGMWDGIKDAFRSALNWIIDHWNGLKFSLPSFDTHIPGIGTVGGFTIQVPQIPRFDQGGWVPGAMGQPLLAVVHGGEFVLSRDMINAAGFSPPTTPAADSPGAVVEVHNYLYLDGEPLRNAVVRQTQRTKLRNGNSLVT